MIPAIPLVGGLIGALASTPLGTTVAKGILGGVVTGVVADAVMKQEGERQRALNREAMRRGCGARNGHPPYCRISRPARRSARQPTRNAWTACSSSRWWSSTSISSQIVQPVTVPGQFNSFDYFTALTALREQLNAPQDLSTVISFSDSPNTTTIQ